MPEGADDGGVARGAGRVADTRPSDPPAAGYRTARGRWRRGGGWVIGAPSRGRPRANARGAMGRASRTVPTTGKQKPVTPRNRACRMIDSRLSRTHDERSSATLPAMCGIVGYVGARPALNIVLDGLRRLEYRGYDSAGVAVIDDGALLTEKRAGKLANLEKALAERRRPTASRPGTTGIGHTRWATHGGPTDRNAHPHLSGRRPGRRDPQRHHRELRPAARRARGRRRRVRQRHRHRVRRAPARRRAGRAARRAAPSTARSCSPRRMRRVVPPAGGRVHAARRRRRRARRGGRRPAQLAAGGRPRRRARTSSPATWPRSSSTPARRSSWARTRSC